MLDQRDRQRTDVFANHSDLTVFGRSERAFLLSMCTFASFIKRVQIIEPEIDQIWFLLLQNYT